METKSFLTFVLPNFLITMEQKRNYRQQNKSYVPKTSEMGRLQPQDRELEEAVLGALMLEKTHIRLSVIF